MNTYHPNATATRRQGPNRDVGPDASIDCPKVNLRRFESLHRMMGLGGLYLRGREFGKPDETAYYGIESPRRVNQTIVPPWRAGSTLVFGSTMGHDQIDPSPDPRPILEVYQAWTPALMLIDRHGSPTMELYVLKRGEKVGTPNDSIMTILNVGTEPAILVDLANPARHQSSKEIQMRSGPAIAMCYEAGCVRVRLNPNYVDRADGYGVTEPRTLDEIALATASADPKAVAKTLFSPKGRRALGLRGIRVRRPDQAGLAKLMGIEEAALDGCLADLRKDDLGHPLVRYFFGRPSSGNGGCGTSSKRRVAVIGGWGEAARNRIAPAIQATDGAEFVCAEMVAEPTDHAEPHPYSRWYGPDKHPNFYREVFQGRFSQIHLSTPPGVTGELLVKIASAQVERVVADKPWFPDYSAAETAAGALTKSPVQTRFFDHYLYRGAVQAVLGDGVRHVLDGPIESIKIHLLESAPYTTAAQGDAGILADLAIHGVSLAHAFLPGDQFQVTKTRAARHVDSTYPTETFCAVELDAIDGPHRIPIQLVAAKYMPSAQATKEMVIVGTERQIHFDLARDTADLVHRMGAERIYPDGRARIPAGYEVLVQKLATGEEVGLELAEALSVHRVLRDARDQFPAPLPVLTPDVYSLLLEEPEERQPKAA